MVVIGIDLAGKRENPSGLAIWKNKRAKTSLVYVDQEILENITRNKPTLTAIDAHLTLPKGGVTEKGGEINDRERHRIFPPKLPAKEELSIRATKLNTLIAERGYKATEVRTM